MDREPTAIVAPSFYMSAAQHHRPSSAAATASSRERDDDEEEESCRHCGSRSLHVDWAQGDKVCTHCGVVAEEKMLEERPEWRDFNEAEDLAKGAPASARCGLVPVDESRYLGGLQPTTLTRAPFGGPTPSSAANAGKLAMIRKRLLSTNRKLDHMMLSHHARALKNARISRLVRKRQLVDGTLQQNNQNETDQETDLESVFTTADEDVRPDLEQILIREEEDANRMQTALNSDKWSLRRAILLHGNHETLEDPTAAISERNDLQQRLDSKLRKASADLYKAYRMLESASRRLELPDRVTHEATTMLCRYAALRDGFMVKGVSSRLAIKKSNLSALQQKHAVESLREHNKSKQMGSLCAALLLLTARKLGWPRPLTEVCGSVQAPKPNTSRWNSAGNDSSFVKAKHCSRAMEEIKSSFPDYARSIATPNLAAAEGNSARTGTGTATSASAASRDPDSTIHFVDHSVRKLQLPPVAEASVRALVWHCCQEQHTTGQQSGTKLSTICASLVYFVCLSGSIMQQLASQAQMREKNETRNVNSSSNHNNVRGNKYRLLSFNAKRKSRKEPQRQSSGDMLPPPPPKKKAKVNNIRVVSKSESEDSADDDADEPVKESGVFDVFSHAVGSEVLAQQREYEMRRVWDAWVEQTSWLRSVSEVEQSSGVSSNTILSHYKSDIYPRRQALLEWLRDAVIVGGAKTGAAGATKARPNNTDGANILTDTPLATVLLSHVAAAAPLLNSSGKQDTSN